MAARHLGAWLYLLLLGASSVLILAQPSAPVELRLANGLLVLIDAPASTTRLEVTTGYFAGFRDEPESARGLAHLVEHLAMRETRGGPTLAAAFAEYGIEAAAVTGGDVTTFTESGPASAATLETILRFERLRMMALALEASAIEIEKRRVAIEVGSRENEEPWRRALFGTSRLARVSSHADLARLDEAAVRRFYSTYYTPRNCAVVIASPRLALVDVRRAVEQALASVPGGAALPRPALRDVTPLVPRWWTGAAPAAGTGHVLAAVSVPGLQHADRIPLERDINAITGILEGSRPGKSGRSVSIDVTDEAPAAVLRVRSSSTDPALAREDLDDFLGLLSVSMHRTAGGRSGAGRAPLRTRTRPSWLDCEAAGAWRYCLDVSEARSTRSADFAPATLDRYIRTARANGAGTKPDPAISLWPAQARKPVAATPTGGSGATADAARWIAPDLADFRWSETARGLQWAGVRGGTADSVVIGAWLTLRPETAALGDISALELLARTWGTLQLPSGERFQEAAAALGASVRVRSLPYPPLATTDKFRTLGVPPTPIGTVGVEVVAAAPRQAGEDVARLLGEAITSGEPDHAAVAAERERQLQMLRASTSSVPFAAEVAFRRSVPALGSESGPAFRPAPLADQITSMERTTPAGVAGVAKRMVLEGTVRLVMLGVSPADGEAWIGRTPWNALNGARVNPTAAECPSSVPTEVRIPGAQKNANVYFGLCIPVGSPSAVPPAALVVNALLGGREDALLAARLRTETGLAYAFESRVVPEVHGRATLWYLSISTAADKVDEAIVEVRAVLEHAANAGVPADRIASFREWLAGQREERGRDGFTWVTTVLMSGLAPDQEAAAIRATTDAEVNALLRAWWRAARLTITVTTGGARVDNPRAREPPYAAKLMTRLRSRAT